VCTIIVNSFRLSKSGKFLLRPDYRGTKYKVHHQVRIKKSSHSLLCIFATFSVFPKASEVFALPHDPHWPRRVFCFLISTLSMVSTPIQDRTSEFRAILTQAQKRQNSSKVGSQRASLLSDAQKREANGSAAPAGSERRARSEFARNAAQVGRGITASMGKLERLAQCISHPVTLSNTG
jgi:Syntaxin-5 N-terminal, Sly1p-binding domain